MAKKFSAKYFDYTILLITIFLVGFGLVMIYSTSAYTSSVRYGTSTHWLTRQFAIAMVSFVFMILISFIDYRKLKHWLVMAIIYGGCIASLCLVLMLGAVTKGSKRWISILGIQLQPSEFAKGGLILVLAYYISQNSHKMKQPKQIFKCLMAAGVIIVLVVVENLSTAIVLCAITGVLIFVVSPRTKELLGLLFAGISVAVLYLILGPSYRMERIQIWLHPETHEKGLQTMQALYAIGSGGVFGKGLGHSMQKMGFIPESHNDMIFSIVCEELGLFGALAIILAFVVLIWRILIIAVNAPDLFGSLLTIGVAVHIGVQMMINIGVVTNCLPPTGIPLPFISYGGSSILALLMEIGLVLSVSRTVKVS